MLNPSFEKLKDYVHESQDERRRGNTSECYTSVVSDRELRRATRERVFMQQGDRGSRK